MVTVLDLADVGVEYGSDRDQGSLIQQAIDKASGQPACSVTVSGLVRSSIPLENPTNVPIIGVGAGEAWDTSPSAIVFTTDADEPGTPAIRFAAYSRPVQVRDITLAGPGINRQTGWGELPANLYGIHVPTRCLIERVRIQGFGAAVSSVNDHQCYRDIDLRSNGYGIDFVDNPDGGLGDMLFDHFLLNDQSRAGIAISDSAVLVNARFMGNGHFGSSPFAIYRYKGAAGDRGQALQGVVFENTSFESCGSGMFYDEPGTGSWSNITFDSPAEIGTFGWAGWPGKQAQALLDVGTAAGIYWRGGSAVSSKPLIRARSLADIVIDRFDPMTAAKPFEISGDYSQWGQECSDVTIGRMAARVAHEPIRKGDLVERCAYTHVQRSRNTLTSLIVGVSIGDFDTGDVCLYGRSVDHWSLGVNNTSGATIPQGALIQPDPDHIGGVKKATTREKAIGRVTNPLNPGFGQAQVEF